MHRPLQGPRQLQPRLARELLDGAAAVAQHDGFRPARLCATSHPWPPTTSENGPITSVERRSLLVCLTHNTRRQSRHTTTPAPCQLQTNALQQTAHAAPP